MISKATLGDVAMLVGLARTQSARVKGLIFDDKKMGDIMRQAVSSASDFAWVSGGAPGGLVAAAYPSLWTERKTAFVVLFSAEDPSSEDELLSAFTDWVASRRAIKQIEMHIDIGADSGLKSLLERLGFAATETIYKKIR